MKTDLDAVKKLEPVVERVRCADDSYRWYVYIGDNMGQGTTKWKAADDLVGDLEVEIERLTILRDKALKVCQKAVREENEE